jgi:hypothetical protein
LDCYLGRIWSRKTGLEERRLDDGRAFMENVYNASSTQETEKIDERIDRDATQEK